MGLYSRSRRYRDYQPGKKKRSWFRKITFFIILLLIVFNFFSCFLITSYRNGSASMAPVLPEGARFLATPLVYGNDTGIGKVKIPGFRSPRRGEVVLVSPAYLVEDSNFKLILDGLVRFFTLQKVSIHSTVKNEWENRMVPKRIIGVPGDELKMEAHKVYIRPEGESSFRQEGSFLGEWIEILYPEFPENWGNELPFSGNLTPFVLGEGEYFLLSDNRGKGSDGSVWGISREADIRKKIILRFWPSFKFKL